MKTKTKIKLIAAAAALVLAAALLCGFMIWHNREMRELRADIEASMKPNPELDEQTREALSRLSAENDDLKDTITRVQQEKSELEKVTDELKDKLDALTNPVVEVDAEQVEADIRSIGELATVEYVYKNVGVFRGDRYFDIDKGTKIPFTGKEAIITMQGTLKAGIDFAQVTVECDDAKKLVTVHLPEAQYLSNELDESSLETIIDEQSVFNKKNEEDSSALRQQIKETAIEYADKNQIKQQADERAQMMIREIIEAIPNFKGNYDLAFETIK